MSLSIIVMLVKMLPNIYENDITYEEYYAYFIDNK